jgi:hypothetical protein
MGGKHPYYVFLGNPYCSMECVDAGEKMHMEDKAHNVQEETG